MGPLVAYRRMNGGFQTWADIDNMADENMTSEPYESSAPRKKNPWLVIVIAVITLTIIVVILRLWEFLLVLSILLLLNLS